MNGRESDCNKKLDTKRKRSHNRYDSASSDEDTHDVNWRANGNKKQKFGLGQQATTENESIESVSNDCDMEIEEPSSTGMDNEDGIGTTVVESVIACSEMGLLTQDLKESSSTSECVDEGQHSEEVSSPLSPSVSKKSKMNVNDISVRDTTPRRSGTRVLRLLESDGETSVDDEHTGNLSSSLHHEGENGIEHSTSGHKNSLLRPSIPNPSNYMERINANRQRNADRLVELGLASKPMTDNVETENDCGQNVEGGCLNEEFNSTVTKPLHSGMLFATKYNGLPTVSGQVPHTKKGEVKNKRIPLEEQYPHRTNQIRFLKSCFKSTVRQAQYSHEYRDYDDDCHVYIPPPILVSGTRGTGKTAIVRSILGEVKHDTDMKQINSTNIHGGLNRNRGTMGVAYIDCATCENRGIGAGAGTLFESAYDQLAKQFGQQYSPYSLLQNDRVQVKEAKKSTEKSVGPKNTLPPNNRIDPDNNIQLDPMAIDKLDELSVDSSLGTNSFDTRSEDGNEDSTIGDGNEDEEDWIENRRKKYVSSSANSVSSSIASQSQRSRDSRRRSARVGSKNNTQHTRSKVTMPKNQKSSKVSQSKRVGIQKMEAIETPVAFGRSISQFCGDSMLNSGPSGCAFFILDNAEKLLSFTSDKQKAKAQLRTNWLSQILLLPKVMKLNLTIIVISCKTMLEDTSEFSIN